MKIGCSTCEYMRVFNNKILNDFISEIFKSWLNVIKQKITGGLLALCENYSPTAPGMICLYYL